MKKYQDIITGYLRNHQEHRISATDIFNMMKENSLDVNKTTVYRNLDKLEAEGKLQKYKLPEAHVSYYRYIDDQKDCRDHLHMQCARCGRIFHLNCDFMDEIRNHLQTEHGFLLDCNESLLVGYCKECQKELAHEKDSH